MALAVAGKCLCCSVPCCRREVYVLFRSLLSQGSVCVVLFLAVAGKCLCCSVPCCRREVYVLFCSLMLQGSV